MDATSWTAPPGAAQPTGIQSTAGAVPIMNEKGEVSMKKVKVQRYVSGKRPEYAPQSSDEEFSDDEDFTKPQGAPPSPTYHKTLTDVELQDPRLRRLLSSTHKISRPESDDEDNGYSSEFRERTHIRNIEDDDNEMQDYNNEINQTIMERRRVIQPEVVEVSEDEDKVKDITSSSTIVWPSHRLADSDSESEDEVDEEEMTNRRLRLKEKAMMKAQQEEEILGKEDEGSEESSEEESSEYTEESDSEEEGPRLKPVFVRKKERVTVLQKEAQQNKVKQQDQENRRRQEERRRDTLRIIEQENRVAAANAANLSDPSLQDVNTDDEADDAEYEAWKTRELRRLKRDKEERDAAEREKDEVERLRTMTEEERRIELRNNPKTITNKAAKGKYKFLQKYYHRGVFFLDQDEDVYKRDFSGATLEDHFDKTVLPKVMQVKNFGRSGRTKYTHLVDQDTTSFDSPWAADSQMNHKFFNSNAGGVKQAFDKPTTKKRSGGMNSSSRK